MLNFVANAITFVCLGVFFGGIGFIWGDVFFGLLGGLVLGLITFIAAGWLSVKISGAIGQAIGQAIWGKPEEKYPNRYV